MHAREPYDSMAYTMNADCALRSFCKSGNFIAVDDPRAYDEFVSGQFLADASPNAEKLTAFCKKNESEFYGTIIARLPDGGFPHTSHHGHEIWFTWHKHKVAENSMKAAQEIIKDCPWLDC